MVTLQKITENARVRRRKRDTENAEQTRPKKKDALLLKCRSDYAAMPKDDILREKEKERHRKRRANMTKEEKDALLLRRRSDYAAMPKDDMLRSRREAYGKIKCTIKGRRCLRECVKPYSGYEMHTLLMKCYGLQSKML